LCQSSITNIWRKQFYEKWTRRKGRENLQGIYFHKFKELRFHAVAGGSEEVRFILIIKVMVDFAMKRAKL
jgi:hypothetical protein